MNTCHRHSETTAAPNTHARARARARKHRAMENDVDSQRYALFQIILGDTHTCARAYTPAHTHTRARANALQTDAVTSFFVLFGLSGKRMTLQSASSYRRCQHQVVPGMVRPRVRLFVRAPIFEAYCLVGFLPQRSPPATKRQPSPPQWYAGGLSVVGCASSQGLAVAEGVPAIRSGRAVWHVVGWPRPAHGCDASVLWTTGALGQGGMGDGRAAAGRVRAGQHGRVSDEVAGPPTPRACLSRGRRVFRWALFGGLLARS